MRQQLRSTHIAEHSEKIAPIAICRPVELLHQWHSVFRVEEREVEQSLHERSRRVCAEASVRPEPRLLTCGIEHTVDLSEEMALLQLVPYLGVGQLEVDGERFHRVPEPIRRGAYAALLAARSAASSARLVYLWLSLGT